MTKLISDWILLYRDSQKHSLTHLCYFIVNFVTYHFYGVNFFKALCHLNLLLAKLNVSEIFFPMKREIDTVAMVTPLPINLV